MTPKFGIYFTEFSQVSDLNHSKADLIRDIMRSSTTSQELTESEARQAPQWNFELS